MMFICGNDDTAKKIVSGIIDQFGWETADMGKAEAARAIEPLCMLWCIPGFLHNDWTHAFKLLRCDRVRGRQHVSSLSDAAAAWGASTCRAPTKR
jgi:hypothetical protein